MIVRNLTQRSTHRFPRRHARTHTHTRARTHTRERAQQHVIQAKQHAARARATGCATALVPLHRGLTTLLPLSLFPILAPERTPRRSRRRASGILSCSPCPRHHPGSSLRSMYAPAAGAGAGRSSFASAPQSPRALLRASGRRTTRASARPRVALPRTR